MFAYTGEPLNLPRFDLPVVIDCATLDLSAQSIPALLEHMPYTETVVGQIESIEVAGPAGTPPVVAYGYFTPTDDSKDAATFVIKKADAGFRWQASVGGEPESLERIEAGKTVAVNGRTYAGPCYVARGVYFREISFCVLGEDRRTSVAASARTGEPQDDEPQDDELQDDEQEHADELQDFDSWMESLGFPNVANLPRVLIANFAYMFDGYTRAKLNPESELDFDSFALTLGFLPEDLTDCQRANLELMRQGFALVKTGPGQRYVHDLAPTNA